MSKGKFDEHARSKMSWPGGVEDLFVLSSKSLTLPSIKEGYHCDRFVIQSKDKVSTSPGLFLTIDRPVTNTNRSELLSRAAISSRTVFSLLSN